MVESTINIIQMDLAYLVIIYLFTELLEESSGVLTD